MLEDTSEHKRCKGVKKNVVENRITHAHFKTVYYMTKKKG